MKIAITGHSRGLGAEFTKQYESQGHSVSGFSRSNGHDLRDWSVMQKMLDLIQDHDMFINVAKPDFVQTTILYELWKRWQGQRKIIVNVSSGIAYNPTCPQHFFNDVGIDAYRTAKVSLNEASAQLSFKSSFPHIVLVSPSHLYNDPVTETDQIKLTRWVETFIDVMSRVDQTGFALKQITF